MRRAALAAALVIAAVAAWVAVGSGTHARAAVSSRSGTHAPATAPTVQRQIYGGACLVSAGPPVCDQRPCVEFVGGAGDAVLRTTTTVRTMAPVRRCAPPLRPLPAPAAPR